MAEAQALQVALGKIRRASGHFQAALSKAMSASRTIPSRSPTITPHIETVCANNTRICPTNSNKRASSPLYPGSMTSNSISVSVNLNAALDTAESNYLPLQNLC